MRTERFPVIKSKPYRNFYDLSEVDKFGLHAIAFLEAAENLEVIENRFSNWWIPAYYLLYHSLELAIKTSIGINGLGIPEGHSLTALSKIHESTLNLTASEIMSIQELEELNSG